MKRFVTAFIVLVSATYGTAYAGSTGGSSSELTADTRANAVVNINGKNVATPGEPTPEVMTVMPGSVPAVTSIRDHAAGVPETQALTTLYEITRHFEETINVPRIKTSVQSHEGYRFAVTPYQRDMPGVPGYQRYLAVSLGDEVANDASHPFAWVRPSAAPSQATTPISRVVLSLGRLPEGVRHYKLAAIVEAKCSGAEENCVATGLDGSMRNLLNEWVPASYSEVWGCVHRCEAR